MRMTLRIQLVFLLFSFPLFLFAQPANDECVNPTAISLIVGTATSVVQDIQSATQSATAPSCESGAISDVWYSFTMPVDGNVYISGDYFDGFALYDACGGTELSCFYNKGFLFSLTNGVSYRLRAWRQNAHPGSVNFTIRPFAQAANDECNSATPISLAEGTATSVAQETQGATQSANNPSCEGGAINDVWYSFTMPVDGNVYISGDYLDGFALYDACGGTELSCFNHKGFLFSLTSGTSYRLRAWRRNAYPGSVNFTIRPFAQAVNDECVNPTAISLTIGTATSVAQETQGATQSATNPSCEGGAINDVWYSFTMPVDGNVYISGDYLDGFALYDACGGTELSCFNHKGFLFSLTNGTSYRLRAWRRNAYPGSVNFTIQPFAQILNDDCAAAAPVSISTTCTGATQSVELRGATQSSSTPNCENSPFTDAWFVFDSPIDGDILVKNADFFDKFAFYDGCPQTPADLANPLACFSSNGTLSGVTFGQTIYLQVFRKQQYPGQASFCLEGAYAVADPGAETCASGTVTIDNTNHNQWVPILDGSGKLIASLRANGEDLGATTAEVYIGANPVSTYLGQPYLRRKIIITPTNQPANNVSVRLYLLQNELDDLVNADGNLNNISELEVVKNSQSGCSTTYDGTGDFLLTAGQAYGSDYSLQFDVNSFSSFFPSSVSLAPLPVELVRFAGESSGATNRLQWVTASEENTSHFDIEYSTDGLRWEWIGQRQAHGHTRLEQTYHFSHRPPTQLSYYRLKMVDFDGKTDYSQIIAVSNTHQTGVVLTPNPTKDEVRLDTKQVIHQVEIIDVFGRILAKKTGDNLRHLNVSMLNKGIYYLRINQNQIVRFSKI